MKLLYFGKSKKTNSESNKTFNLIFSKIAVSVVVDYADTC